MIAALFNVPTTARSWAQFSFHNRDQHQLAALSIRAQLGVSLTEYILDPIPVNDLAAWLNLHQQSHNQVNEALGVAGNDLSAVDPNDQGQIEAWIQNHAAEHRAWGNILGIG